MLVAAVLALFTAAASAQALPPVCALNCINAQLASQRCTSFADYACTCTDAFRALAIPCVINSCSAADLALAASTTNLICTNYFNGVYGPVAGRSGAGAAAGAGSVAAGAASVLPAAGSMAVAAASASGSAAGPRATVTLAPAGPGGVAVNPNAGVRTVTVTVDRCPTAGAPASAPTPAAAAAPAPSVSGAASAAAASGSAAAPRVTLPAFVPPAAGTSGSTQLQSFGAVILGLLAFL